MPSHALELKDDRTKRAPFMGVATDEVTRAALACAAEKLGWSDAEILEGSTQEAVRVLSAIPTPGLLAIDVSGGDPLAIIAELASVCDEGTRLIALGEVNDVALFRSLMELGVQDYLVKPVSPDALVASMGKTFEIKEVEEDANDNSGRLVCMIGSRGGCGASTIASNCAWLMANDQNMKVALVDLDLYFGTAALSLDLEPGRGFREALENPGRIDDLFIKRALVPAGGNLFVLGAEESLDNTFAFDPSALDLLLDKLLGDFDCVVVDLPRASVVVYTGVLAAASEVVIVSDPTLAGMRDTMRLADYASKEAPDAAIRVVINRAGLDKNGELGKEDFMKGANLNVDHLIPLDLKAANASNAAARPMVEVANKSKMKTAIRGLCLQLSGRGEEIKTPFWRRLFNAKEM